MVKTRTKHRRRRPAKAHAPPPPKSRNDVLAALRGQFAIVEKKPADGALKFLADPMKMQSEPILTGDPTKARFYSDRSGPYRFLKHHPNLRKTLKAKRIA